MSLVRKQRAGTEESDDLTAREYGEVAGDFEKNKGLYERLGVTLEDLLDSAVKTKQQQSDATYVEI